MLVSEVHAAPISAHFGPTLYFEFLKKYQPLTREFVTWRLAGPVLISSFHVRF